MKITRTALLLVGFALFAFSAAAQVANFTFPAGSPEDQASDAIAKETDPQKKMALLNDFVQQFSSNPLAVAYGGWQLAQAYQQAGFGSGGATDWAGFGGAPGGTRWTYRTATADEMGGFSDFFRQFFSDAAEGGDAHMGDMG